MIKVNFEFLTNEENKDIAIKYNRYNNMFVSGMITKSEANFLFTEYCLEKYKEKAFGIVTNLNMI